MKALHTKVGSIKIIAPLVNSFGELQDAVGQKLAGFAYAKDGKTPRRLIFIPCTTSLSDDQTSAITDLIRESDNQTLGCTFYKWA